MANSKGRFLMPTEASDRQIQDYTVLNKGQSLSVTISFSPEADADDRLSKVAKILMSDTSK